MPRTGALTELGSRAGLILSKPVSGSTGPKGWNGRPHWQLLVTRTTGEPVIAADQEIVNYQLSPQCEILEPTDTVHTGG